MGFAKCWILHMGGVNTGLGRVCNNSLARLVYPALQAVFSYLCCPWLNDPQEVIIGGCCLIGHSTDTLTKAKHTLTRLLSLHYHPLGDFSTTLNANYSWPAVPLAVAIPTLSSLPSPTLSSLPSPWQSRSLLIPSQGGVRQ